MKISMPTVLAVLTLGAAAAGPARASSLLGPLTIINPPAGCTTTAVSPCPEAYSFAAGTSTTNIVVTEGPTNYTFSDQFNQLGATSTDSDFGASVYKTGASCPANQNCLNSSPLLTWNFQDNYDFTTPASGPLVQGAALSFTVPGYGVGLSNLQARIVAYNAATFNPADLVSTSQITVVDGWQSVSVADGPLNLYTAALTTTPLAANTEYVLQLRGEAMVAASYTGSVTFIPVPAPAPLVLLLSGLAGLALVRYRQRGSLQPDPPELAR